ncbi:MAG: alternative oxidase [Pseudomonadota bacterium]
MTNDQAHFEPQTFRDRVAFGFVKVLRFFADLFFRKRYGHRAVVLETVAAVPGMVGGLLQHLRAIRRIEDDRGWIRELLDEAENERMHLMTFIEIAKPSVFERFLIMIAQAIFYNVYFFIYLFAPRTAHRIVGYFEEEAVISYTNYLQEIDAGRLENVPAPQIAIDYWKLPADARLRDVVLVVRADEEGHRDRNHDMANELGDGVVPAVGNAVDASIADTHVTVPLRVVESETEAA